MRSHTITRWLNPPVAWIALSAASAALAIDFPDLGSPVGTAVEVEASEVPGEFPVNEPAALAPMSAYPTTDYPTSYSAGHEFRGAPTYVHGHRSFAFRKSCCEYQSPYYMSLWAGFCEPGYQKSGHCGSAGACRTCPSPPPVFSGNPCGCGPRCHLPKAPCGVPCRPKHAHFNFFGKFHNKCGCRPIKVDRCGPSCHPHSPGPGGQYGEPANLEGESLAPQLHEPALDSPPAPVSEDDTFRSRAPSKAAKSFWYKSVHRPRTNWKD